MVTFSCAQTELRKARERELAILDEKSTSSVMAETYARKTLKEARTGGGRRDDTRDHGFCRSWKVHVREKKKDTAEVSELQTSGARHITRT